MRTLPVLAVLTAVAIAACSGSAPASPAAAPSLVALRGVLLVDLDGLGDDGDPCDVGSGYSDITAGGSVTVTGPGGDVVGIGRLGAGARRNAAGYRVGNCEFRLAVDVPAGLRFYGVSVGHRNAVQVAEANLGRVVITLGG